MYTLYNTSHGVWTGKGAYSGLAGAQVEYFNAGSQTVFVQHLLQTKCRWCTENGCRLSFNIQIYPRNGDKDHVKYQI